MELLANQVISWNGNNYRVLCLFKGKIALYNMASSKLKLDVHPIADLEQRARSGEIKTVPDEYAGLTYLEPSKEDKHTKRAEANYQLIKPIADSPDCLFCPNLRRRMIAKLSHGDSSKRRQLERLLPQFWRRGQTRNALLPQYRQKLEGKDRNSQVKLGRKGSLSPELGLPINDALRKLFRRKIDAHILKPEGLSLSKAFDYVLLDFNEHRHLYTDSPVAKPTFYQFKNFYYNRVRTAERAEKKHSPIAFNKDIRPLHGSVYDITQCIGGIYEADATVADVYLVSDEPEPKLIGRPTLYSVIDTFSGCIAGVMVSPDPPQLKLLNDVLFIAFNRKADYCAAHGVNITDADWPISGIPACITTDNAEALGKRIEHFAGLYGISLTNTASYRGDQKGTVEESLHLLQSQVKGLIKAAPSKLQNKKSGAIDLRGKAVLTLKDYTSLVLRAAMVVNTHVRKKTNCFIPPDVVTADGIWNYCKQHGLTNLRYPSDQKMMRIALLPQFEVSLSRDGALAKGLGITYYCSELSTLGYLNRCRNNAEKKQGNMKLYIDPANVSRAWLFPQPDEVPNQYWECTLASESMYLTGKTMTEAKEYMKIRSQAIAKARAYSHQFSSNILSQQLQTVKAAEERIKKSGADIPSSIKDVAQTAHDERIRHERSNQRFPMDDSNPATSCDVKQQPQSSPLDDEPEFYSYPDLDEAFD